MPAVLNNIPGNSNQTAYRGEDRWSDPGARSAADVAALVLTVRVEVVFPGVNELGLSEQVGGTAVAGVTAHVRATVAASPALGVIVTVAVAEAPADIVGVESAPVDGSVKSSPVPERVIDCGLPAALSVTVRAALRAPVADGVIVTLMVQEPGPGTEAQLLVWEKSPLSAPVIATVAVRVVPAPVLDNVTGMGALLVLTA